MAIDISSLSPKTNKTRRGFGGIEAPWLIIAALLAATVLTAYQNQRQTNAEATARFEEMAAGARQTVQDNLQRIDDITAAVGAMAAIVPMLDQQRWSQYFDQHIAAAPTLIGLKRVEYWRLGETDADGNASVRFIRNMATDSADKDILPRLPITALNATILQAKRTRHSAISAPITLDQRERGQFVVMVNYVAPLTPQREDAYVIALIRLNDIIDALVQKTSQRLHFAVQEHDQTLFSDEAASRPSEQETKPKRQFVTSIPLNIGQRDWQLNVGSTPALDAGLKNPSPQIILLVGVLGTLLLAGLVWLLTRLREQANHLAESMTEKLRDQAKFTEDLIELNPNPIFRKDAEGRFTAVNRAWEQMSGRDRSEVLGRANRDFQTPEIAAQNELHDQQLFNSVEGQDAREVFITNSTGREFQTIVAKQVLRRRDGSIDGLIGTVTDVTPIKLLEQRLALQQEQLDLVIRSSQQGIWDIDLTEGGNAYYSDRFREILGYAPTAFPDNFTWEKWIYEDDKAQFVHELTRSFKRETPFFDVEGRTRRADNTYIWIRGRGITQHDASGCATRFVGSIVDISDRKKAEADLIEANIRVTEAARAKEAFLATMSHEIRTPLNGVLGMTSLLAETELNDEQRDYIRLVRASGDTLLRLIDDVLDFSKIESGRMTLETVPVETVAVVEEAFEIVAEKAREKQLVLISELSDDVPPYILGDATRIRQILLNLLSNAIKFTAQGEIICSLTARSLANQRIEIEGRVTDTGIGIPAARAVKLFQPFTQADASTTRKYGGTGLGLAIVKRLTEIMGGAIHVESTEGIGSTFTFTIQTSAVRGPLRPYMQRNLAEFQGKRLLLIDSNVKRLAILERQFIKWGLSIYSSLPDQCLVLHEQEGPFDMVVTDMLEPNKYALDLQTAITHGNKQRADNAEQPTAVILLSSMQRADLSRRGLMPVLTHQIFATRPVGRSRMFDILMRAATNAVVHDVATRPFMPEPALENGNAAHSPASATMVALENGSQFSLGLEPANATINHNAIDVLVAEDNEVNQRVMQGMLTKLGHRVHIANDGQAAVDAALTMHLDLIMMDIQMPILDGIAAMREIRAKFGAQSQDGQGSNFSIPPIVAMTANAMAGDREHYLQQGMDDYLAKPIRPNELTALIDRMVPRARNINKLSALNTLASAPGVTVTFASATGNDVVTAREGRAALPVLDFEQLDDMRGLPSGSEVSGAFASNGLIELFREKSAERLAAMEAELVASDWLALGDTTHSMRGAAASIGFPRVAAACKQLELNSRRLTPKPGVPPVSTDTPLPSHREMDQLFEEIKVLYLEANTALTKWLTTPNTA